MNVYEKLAEARVRFQNGNPKMSGQNKFAGYTYFELADILPVINVLGKELKFAAVVSFDDRIATLMFIDTEKPTDMITFTSPMSTASLKGCHDVQNLGAVQTYLKRYLYQNCFEIVESDALNGSQPITEPKQASNTMQTKEIVMLKGALIDYINAGVFEHPENVNKVIADNNLDGMRKALAVAKEKEKKNDTV